MRQTLPRPFLLAAALFAQAAGCATAPSSDAGGSAPALSAHGSQEAPRADGSEEAPARAVGPEDAPSSEVVARGGLGNPILERKLDNGFYLHTAARPDGGRATLYANRKDLESGPAMPALVVATGSGCAPAFRKREDGSLTGGFPGHFLSRAGEEYTILVLEKRGVSLADYDDEAPHGAGTGCSEEYHGHATLPGRAEELRLLLEGLGGWEAVSADRVLLVGHSEGTDVVAAIGSHPAVTHVGFLAGGGPTQMFDFVIMFRERLREAPPDVAEQQMAGLMEQFRDIYRHPDSTEKMMFGHPYSRWAGFFSHPPIEGLLRIDVPLFVAHGSADDSVPIHSADFIEVEFIRHGKTNLTFRRYAGLDHSFWRCGPIQEGCRQDRDNNEMGAVIGDLMSWVESAD